MRLFVLFLMLAFVVSGCAMSGGDKKKEASSKPSKKRSSGDSDSEISMEELEVGHGEKPKEGDTVKVHYTGRLDDGTVFDSSYDRGKPFEYKLGSGTVVKGWEEALPEMQLGGKYKVRIPPSKGYGSKPHGNIPENSVLNFEMELIKIIKKKK